MPIATIHVVTSNSYEIYRSIDALGFTVKVAGQPSQFTHGGFPFTPNTTTVMQLVLRAFKYVMYVLALRS